MPAVTCGDRQHVIAELLTSKLSLCTSRQHFDFSVLYTILAAHESTFTNADVDGLHASL